MENSAIKFKTNSYLNALIISLVLLFGLTVNNHVLASCHPNVNNQLESCSSYNTQCFINTKNSEIAFVNTRSKYLFKNECVSHQICYNDSLGSKNSCDETFINDIKYQCKVNFGRLLVIKQVPKRTRTCLKRVKKACSNFKRNCGRTCVLYGTGKISIKEVTQYIKAPRRADYKLPGAKFYPGARYEACIAVTRGYQSAISHQRSKKHQTVLKKHKSVISFQK